MQSVFMSGRRVKKKLTESSNGEAIMRELTFVGPGKVEWRDAPAPVLDGPNQALVRPIAVATCDLDVMLLRGNAPMFGANFPLGHECIARGKLAPKDRKSTRLNSSHT